MRINKLEINDTFDAIGVTQLTGVTLLINSGSTDNEIATAKAIYDYSGGGGNSYWTSGSTGTNSISTIANINSGGDATGDYSHAEGNYTNATGDNSHSEGNQTKSSGINSHAEGYYTTASGAYSHAEGNYTNATGDNSHAEGNYTNATGDNSHSEGNYTYAQGETSHAEGYFTKTYGTNSHAEGSYTIASGTNSHAEGFYTQSNGNYSHVGGKGNPTLSLYTYGDVTFNHSHQSSTTTQYGVYANYSAILGGTDNKIESSATNSAIIGGETLNNTQPNTVMVPALVLGTITTPTNPQDGTIYFNGFNFYGWNGSVWKQLDN